MAENGSFRPKNSYGRISPFIELYLTVAAFRQKNLWSHTTLDPFISIGTISNLLCSLSSTKHHSSISRTTHLHELIIGKIAKLTLKSMDWSMEESTILCYIDSKTISHFSRKRYIQIFPSHQQRGFVMFCFRSSPALLGQ